MIYWLISASFLCLGFLGYRGVYFAALLAVALPIGNAYSEYFYRYGLFVYDYYFVALILCLLHASLKGQAGLLKSNVLILVMVLVLYALVSLVDVAFDKYYLRDFRLVIFVLQVYLLLSVAAADIDYGGQRVLVFFLVAALSSLFFALAGYYGFVSFEDVFYEKNSFRYFAVSSYVSVVFVLVSRFLSEETRSSLLYYLVLMLSFAAVFVTGFRLLIFLVVAIFAFTRMRTLGGVVATGVGLLALAFLLVGADGSQLVQRVGSVDGGVIAKDLTSRYSPFFDRVGAFSNYELVLGAGFGSVFEIPWFAYRETKDVLNNFVDSAYLTLYAKLGVLSVLYLVIVTRSLVSLTGMDCRGGRVSVIAFLCGAYLVYCVPYQSAAVGLLFGLFFLRFIVDESSTRLAGGS